MSFNKKIHYENSKPTASLICIFQDKLLLIKRAIEPAKGFWGLPGGFIELGETPDEGAIRELKEETNLSGQLKFGYWVTVHITILFLAMYCF